MTPKHPAIQHRGGSGSRRDQSDEAKYTRPDGTLHTHATQGGCNPLGHTSKRFDGRVD
jgi:hypothetical protein